MQRRRIVEARKLGYTYNAICQMENVSFRSVEAVIKAAGLVRVQNKHRNIVAPEPKRELASFHIQELMPECAICKVQDQEIGYFNSQDKDYCPQCLSKLTIADIKVMGETALNELFK